MQKYIDRLLALSKECLAENEPPFSALVVKGGKIIAESKNRVAAHRDVTQHAEILAIKQALATLKNPTLEGCTFYSICEPCPMCSFILRELHISKVVFCLYSKNMGGFSKWNILGDKDLEKLPVFSLPPKVVGGVREREAAEIFTTANFHHMFTDLTNVTKKIKR